MPVHGILQLSFGRSGWKVQLLIQCIHMKEIAMFPLRRTGSTIPIGSKPIPAIYSRDIIFPDGLVGLYIPDEPMVKDAMPCIWILHDERQRLRLPGHPFYLQRGIHISAITGILQGYIAPVLKCRAHQL